MPPPVPPVPPKQGTRLRYPVGCETTSRGSASRITGKTACNESFERGADRSSRHVWEGINLRTTTDENGNFYLHDVWN